MIGPEEFVCMIRGAAARVRSQHALLSELDSAAGDGDHGTTMLRAVSRLESVAGEPVQRDVNSLVQAAGWALLGVDGGAAGSLLGTMFLGMADAVQPGAVLDANAVADMFEGGLAAVRRQTKADIGDKTMMDALIPAVAAMRAGVEAGDSIGAVLKNAADAARRGAASTKDFVARFGRAKYLGEKTLGHQDPGANSIALIFEGLHEAYTEQERKAVYG